MIITKAFSKFRDDSPAETSGTKKENPNPEQVYSTEDKLLTLHWKRPNII